MGSESGSSEYQPLSYWQQVLRSCRSWLASMIIHLLVILSLALLTLTTSLPQTVRLELSGEDYVALTDLEALELDVAEWKSLQQEESTPELTAEKLMEFQPELAIEEFQDSPMGFDNPLDSNVNQLQRLTRDMSSHELVAGTGTASFFGIEASGESVVYIVDRSGSMQGPRWENATRELLKSVNSLRADQKFFVFLFSGSCHPMPQMEGRNELVTATEENKQRFRKWLLDQYPDDTTKPLASVRRAMKMNPDTIFLLTDGQFYDKTGEFLIRQARLQENRTDGVGQVINTIAFYCEFELELMLQEIAAVHNGTFRSIQ